MDPATMQNLLLFGGGNMQGMGGMGQGGGDGQGGNQSEGGGDGGQDMLQQQAAMGGMGGYNQLMRQYLAQQQQQQNMMNMGGFGMNPGMGMNNFMNPGMGGFMNPGMGQDGQGGPNQNQQNQMMMMMGNGNAGGGMNPMAMGGMGGGMQGGGGPDYMDANRMLLQRLQGQNQQEQFDGSGAAQGGGGGGGPPAAAAANAAGGDPYAENGILGPWSATSAGLLGKMAVNNQDKGKKIRRKSKDKPKRPLSAYNIFFKEERQRILEKIPEGEEQKAGAAAGDAKTRKRKKRPHGKIGFENLAKVIGQRWQELTPEQVEYYKKKAEEDMKRYKDQMEEYLAKQDDGKKKASDDGEEGDEDGDDAPTKKLKTES